MAPKTGTKINRKVCAETGKVEYTSKHDAREALVGQMRSKSVRLYRCTFDPSHLHLTTKWKNRLKHAG